MCQDYAKLSRYCSIRQYYYCPIREEETKAQRGDITCQEMHGQSSLIPKYIVPTETICFSISFTDSPPLLFPLLWEFLGALSWAHFSSLSLLFLGNLTYFLVFNNHPLHCLLQPMLLSGAPDLFLQLPTGQQHMISQTRLSSFPQNLLFLPDPIS